MNHLTVDGLQEKNNKLIGDAVRKLKLVRVTQVLNFCESAWKEYWFRSIGFEAADKISKESAEFGTKVHKLVEQDLLEPVGLEVTPEGQCAAKILSYIKEYRIVPLFHVWPDSLEVEVSDKKLGLIGHFDMAALICGEAYIVDFKTSNKMRKSFPLQKAAYAKMANKMFGVKINKGLTIRSHWNKEKQGVEFEVRRIGLNSRLAWTCGSTLIGAKNNDTYFYK